MKDIYDKLNDLRNYIGKTPLIKIPYYFAKKHRTVFAKLEWFNPTGSIKDRAAFEIIENAYLEGKLERYQPIVEATSGNMGLSLCYIGAQLGNPVILTMPETVSEERKKLFELYGVEIHYTKTLQDAIELADKIQKERNAYRPNQFDNKYNVLGQSRIADELLIDIKGRNVTTKYGLAFVSGVGSGGTLMGVASKLHFMLDNKVRIYVAEIIQAPIFSQYNPGKHCIQGLAEHSIPANYKSSKVNSIVRIDENDIIAMAQKLNKAGYPVGLSGAANFLAGVLSGEKSVFTVFPDDNKKYLSTELTKPCKSEIVKHIKLK